jgi:hypothetical protein
MKSRGYAAKSKAAALVWDVLRLLHSMSKWLKLTARRGCLRTVAV